MTMSDDGFFNGMSPCEVGTDCTDCGVQVSQSNRRGPRSLCGRRVVQVSFFVLFKYMVFACLSIMHSYSTEVSICFLDLPLPCLALPRLTLALPRVLFAVSLSQLQYVAEGTCTNTCQHSRDGYCDDPRSSGVCPSGTDCQVSHGEGDEMGSITRDG